MLDCHPLHSVFIRLASRYRSCPLTHVAILKVFYLTFGSNFALKWTLSAQIQIPHWGGHDQQWSPELHFPVAAYIHATLVNCPCMHSPSTYFDDLCVPAGSVSSADISA